MKTFMHSGVIIHHHGDYSGDAIINVRELEVEQLSDAQGGTYYSFKLPCAALAALSWDAAMSKIVEVVEQVAFPGEEDGE